MEPTKKRMSPNDGAEQPPRVRSLDELLLARVRRRAQEESDRTGKASRDGESLPHGRSDTQA